MQQMLTFLRYELGGNSLQDILVSLLIWAGLVLIIRIGMRFAVRAAKRFNRWWPKVSDDVIEKCRRLILPVLHVRAFYFAWSRLDLSPAWDKFLATAWMIVFCVQAVRIIMTFVDYYLEKFWFSTNERNPKSRASRSLATWARLLIWGVGLVFLLDNLGFNVTAIVAGLGIGGIAIALAAQTILGDLFNYFVILFDKPFEEGDFIVSGNFMGEIENIGIKSTRIRALSGQQMVIANSQLTSNLVHNYKRMSKRRIEFRFTVSHKTTLEQLQKVPEMIKKAVTDQKQVAFDRAHVKEMTDLGYVIEAVYFVLTDDYNKYMDIQQAINLKIREAFDQSEIRFARQLFTE